MKWQEIRNHYPAQWLLIEAIKAHSESGKHILDEISVVATFPDSVAAMKTYAELHHEQPERELYVLHTSREQPGIIEGRSSGIRCFPW